MLVWMGFLSLLLNVFTGRLLFWEVKKNRELYLAEGQNKWPCSLMIYSGLMLVISVGLALFITSFYEANSFLFTLKRVALMAVMWPIAYTDFRTLRIPNQFVLCGLISRSLLLISEFIWEREYFLPTLLTDVAAAVFLFLVAAVCALVVKNSIGAGDMKLFLVMGLHLGLQGTWGAMFLSLIVSFVAAVFLLLTRRKSRKDAIPFGPAMVIGTYLSIFLTGM